MRSVCPQFGLSNLTRMHHALCPDEYLGHWAYGYMIVFLKSKKSLELKGFQSLWKQLCSWQNCRKRIRSLTPLWMFCRSFRSSFYCWLSFGKPRWVSAKSRLVRSPIVTCPSTWFDRDRTLLNPILSGSFFMAIGLALAMVMGQSRTGVGLRVAGCDRFPAMHLLYMHLAD